MEYAPGSINPGIAEASMVLGGISTGSLIQFSRSRARRPVELLGRGSRLDLISKLTVDELILEIKQFASIIGMTPAIMKELIDLVRSTDGRLFLEKMIRSAVYVGADNISRITADISEKQRARIEELE